MRLSREHRIGFFNFSHTLPPQNCVKIDSLTTVHVNFSNFSKFLPFLWRQSMISQYGLNGSVISCLTIPYPCVFQAHWARPCLIRMYTWWEHREASTPSSPHTWPTSSWYVAVYSSCLGMNWTRTCTVDWRSHFRQRNIPNLFYWPTDIVVILCPALSTLNVGCYISNIKKALFILILINVFHLFFQVEVPSFYLQLLRNILTVLKKFIVMTLILWSIFI